MSVSPSDNTRGSPPLVGQSTMSLPSRSLNTSSESSGLNVKSYTYTSRSNRCLIVKLSASLTATVQSGFSVAVANQWPPGLNATLSPAGAPPVSLCTSLPDATSQIWVEASRLPTASREPSSLNARSDADLMPSGAVCSTCCSSASETDQIRTVPSRALLAS